MSENQSYIDHCKALIEEKLEWGNSAEWQSQDYDNLSEQILIETRTLISASTLKRIWGKVKYQSKPNITTLDTLSRFIGYQNWRDFVKSCREIAEPKDVVSSSIPVVKKSLFKILAVTLVLVSLFFLVGFLLQKKNASKLQIDNVKFNSKTVSVGVPNTVIFEYDAVQSNADSVFIQQNWDEKRRVKVNKFHHQHASVYYLPGYYRAKLVLNDSIVREHDIFIETEDWIGVLYKDSIPFYLPKDRYRHNSWYGISPQEIDRYLPANGALPSFILTHVNRGLTVDSRFFLLSVNIQNTFAHPAAPCRYTDLTILGTEGAIIIPLSKAGCVGENKLRIGDQLINGKFHDLSAFGIDYATPVNVECDARSGKIKIKLNGKLAYEGKAYKGIGDIVGIRAKFQGAGRLDSFQLRKAQ
ncbi:hypothetical protein HX021_20725 [Sphingobacterium sp. N143]|uniref:hypothetical protein n=1 Tax=Sphingobacterium sp. N143 TaxID=2746727 RepID=UPI0025791399|nr:hypothetical protein [Sphingobacterium sp. N143]MDM1296715.1 hypothetical protein [Sphingobacterium sp. N143]